MNGLDDIVRASLQAQVQDPPAMDSPADHAIARVRVVRRRQAVTAVCAGVAALAVAIGGFAALRDTLPGGGTPVAPATQPAVEPTAAPSATAENRPDLLTNQSGPDLGWRSLVTAEGRTVPLTGVDGRVDTAYRTADGWLVVASTREAGSSLWLVTPDGSAHLLIEKSEGEPAVAPDGRRFAWRSGDRMHVGHLAGATLTVDRSTPAPARGAPIAYTGTAAILGYSETGGGIDHHDLWLPGNGDYLPSWDRANHVITVYQPAPDGSLLGLVRTSQGSKAVCLATLDPAANLKAHRTACGLPLTVDPFGLVSPDGRWLAAPSLDNGRAQVALVDLGRVFDSPGVTATWDAGAPTGWLDATTVVVSGRDGTPMTARIGRPALAPLTGTGVPSGAQVQPVRRLG